MCKGHSIKQCHAGRPYIGTCKRESESLNMTYRDLLAKMLKAKVSTSCGKRNSVENVLKCPLHQERIIMMNKCLIVYVNTESIMYIHTHRTNYRDSMYRHANSAIIVQVL